MSSRVTEKDLQNIVDRLNRMTNSPMAPYSKNAEGRFTAQIGNYHLSHAYGGVCLHRMCNEHGGVTTPVIHGHVPKRILQDAMFAYIQGLQQDQCRDIITWQKLTRSERAIVGDVQLDAWRIGGGARYSVLDAHGAYLDGGQCESLDAAKAAAEAAL